MLRYRAACDRTSVTYSATALRRDVITGDVIVHRVRWWVPIWCRPTHVIVNANHHYCFVNVTLAILQSSEKWAWWCHASAVQTFHLGIILPWCDVNQLQVEPRRYSGWSWCWGWRRHWRTPLFSCRLNISTTRSASNWPSIISSNWRFLQSPSATWVLWKSLLLKPLKSHHQLRQNVERNDQVRESFSSYRILHCSASLFVL